MSQRPLGSEWDYADDPEFDTAATRPTPSEATPQAPGSASDSAGATVREARQPAERAELEPMPDAVLTGGATPDDIRTLAAKRVHERNKFRQALRGYLFTNVLLWVIWGVSMMGSGPEDHGIPWPAWVTVFWGLGLLSQWHKLRQAEPTRNQIEAQIEAETKRLRGH